MKKQTHHPGSLFLSLSLSFSFGVFFFFFYFLMLSIGHLGGHGGVELAEAFSQTGLRGHGLEDAPADAAVLAARHGLGGEVVYAGREAVVYQVGKDLFFFGQYFFYSFAAFLFLFNEFLARTPWA